MHLERSAFVGSEQHSIHERLQHSGQQVVKDVFVSLHDWPGTPVHAQSHRMSSSSCFGGRIGGIRGERVDGDGVTATGGS